MVPFPASGGKAGALRRVHLEHGDGIGRACRMIEVVGMPDTLRKDMSRGGKAISPHRVETGGRARAIITGEHQPSECFFFSHRLSWNKEKDDATRRWMDQICDNPIIDHHLYQLGVRNRSGNRRDGTVFWGRKLILSD